MSSTLYSRYIPPKLRELALQEPTISRITLEAAPYADTEPISFVLERTSEVHEMTDIHKTSEVHPLYPLPQPEPVHELVNIDKSSALPTWLSSPIRISATTTSTFTELGITKEASKNLKAAGFHHAFAVQVAMLRLLLPANRQERGDLLVSAATGSGKTLGYALPMISEMGRLSIARLRGLVVVPTRELAEQVAEVFNKASAAFSWKGRRRVRVKVASANNHLNEWPYTTGTMTGTDLERHARETEEEMCEFYSQREERKFSRPVRISGNQFVADILITTPGSLVQSLQRGFELDYLSWLVIDEADRLLQQSYQQFIKILMASLPKGKEKQLTKIVLSATLTTDLGKLSDLKLRKPQLVMLEDPDEVSAKDMANLAADIHYLPKTLEESAIDCDFSVDKPLHLLHLLQHIAFESEENSERGVLVFTNSGESAMRLSRLLVLLDQTIATQIGTVTSMVAVTERKKVIQKFRNGKIAIIIASDVASRGLDLPNLKYVINYDIPASPEIYVHRVGRTARAGKYGHAYTFFMGRREDRFLREIVASPSIRRAVGSMGVRRVSPFPARFGNDNYIKALEILGKEADKA